MITRKEYKKAKQKEQRTKTVISTVGVGVICASLLAPSLQNVEAAKNTMTIHNVSSNETLWDLARQYQMTVEELKSINHLSSDRIFIGQKLVISTQQDTSQTIPQTQQTLQTAKEMLTTVNTVQPHIVTSGENLWKIARNYNTTVEKIIEDNHLKSTKIKSGDTLQIKHEHTQSTQAVVIGGDMSSTHFKTSNGEVLILRVPYGLGNVLENISGQEVNIVYAGNSLVKIDRIKESNL